MRMKKLQNLLFTLCIVLSCVSSAAQVIHSSGYEGREANVSCSYGGGYESYEKYFCKNYCGNDNVLITTTETKKGRYSIHDDKERRVFTTTISDLSLNDAGKYWCGVSRSGTDIYTEVDIQVRQDTCCGQSTKVQSYETGLVSFSCPYKSQYQENLKYICRGNQLSTCLQQAVVTSDRQQNGQFRLTDDKESRKFTVTITNLTQRDSGSYLCGVRRNTGLDVFLAVELEVKDAAHFHPVVFIVSPILILIIILGIAYRCKYHKVTRTEVTMDRNRTKSAEEEDDVQDDYENQDVVVCSKHGTSKPQWSYNNNDDAVEDQQDSVYQNFSTTEDIY